LLALVDPPTKNLNGFTLLETVFSLLKTEGLKKGPDKEVPTTKKLKTHRLIDEWPINHLINFKLVGI
jgi:hypothetical protein